MFLLLYGRYSLDLANPNWIYNQGGDLFQHQIGWEWFRQEAWQFPLGRIASYGYPLGTNISFTDSIPLLALPLKLLSPLLPAHFQYLGAWELLSVVAQMMVGMAILGLFTRSSVMRLLGASVLVLSPPMLKRAFGHDALTAQWILLAGFWFIFLAIRHRLWRGAWPVLFVAALLVHPYFVAMLLPLWAIGIVVIFTEERHRRLLIAEVLAVPVVLLIEGYCLGLFSVGLSSLQGPGFGNFSWNLNGFVNSRGTSAILPPLESGTPGQVEGYSYLGLGNMLMIPIAAILFMVRDRSRFRWRLLAAFAAADIVYALFALSNRAYIGNHALWAFDLPDSVAQLVGLFRASGRFIWPVFYCVVLFGLITLVRNLPRATALVGLVLVLQLVDLRPLYTSKPPRAEAAVYTSQLKAPFWDALAGTSRHMILIPTGLGATRVYQPMTLYARDHQLTLNTGYFSRADYAAIEAYANDAWEDLLAGHADPQTIYVFFGPEWTDLAKTRLSGKAVICEVDGYSVVLSPANRITQSGFDLGAYCSRP